MIPTDSRYQIEKNKILIFGAGRIGRSFIGQLFARGGYSVVFVDIDLPTVNILNERGSYRIVLKGDTDSEIVVNNVKAIFAGDRDKVREAVSTASIISFSVGKNAVEKVIPLVAEGLKLRRERFGDEPVDIIIAENMISGAEFIRQRLIETLPADYPVDEMVGLVETSIGKMVPIMTKAELAIDPVLVYAEPYNTLILDSKGFRRPVPPIPGLAPKENIKAWVDRKAFIHNLGHATAAYYGFFHHPGAVYISEVLDDRSVLDFTRDVMKESADVLYAAYPSDFSISDLDDHIDDLLFRFRNRALRDTLYRVGHDLGRKLASDDRFMGAVHLAGKYSKPSEKILTAMSYGLFFSARDDEGNFFGPDIKLLDSLDEGFKEVLINKLDFDPAEDIGPLSFLEKMYNELKRLKPVYQ